MKTPCHRLIFEGTVKIKILHHEYMSSYIRNELKIRFMKIFNNYYDNIGKAKIINTHFQTSISFQILNDLNSLLDMVNNIMTSHDVIMTQLRNNFHKPIPK